MDPHVNKMREELREEASRHVDELTCLRIQRTIPPESISFINFINAIDCMDVDDRIELNGIDHDRNNLQGGSVRRLFIVLGLVLVGFAAATEATAGAATGTATDVSTKAAAKVHITYHWHLHQPLYWPTSGRNSSLVQRAAESFDLKAQGYNTYSGSPLRHPLNNLATGDIGQYDPIFSNDDRIAIYQGRGRDSISTLFPYPNAGASISYTGSLMDNIESWGKDHRIGYTPAWASGYQEARQWKTRGGRPRADMVGITYHHSLSPLLPPKVFQKELQIFKHAWMRSWGDRNTDALEGFFPPEIVFSKTLIPILVQEGFKWSIVANGHLARTAANYLESDVAPLPGTGTWNTNPPNKADRVGPWIPAQQWWSGSIDGRGAKVPAPFAYQPHWVEQIDPATGRSYRLIAVPMDEVLSYENGYGMMGTQTIDRKIAPWSDPSRPSLVLMAHDGDNAWGGGHSYYFESVPGFASQAANSGYEMTTIRQFLQDNPVPSHDVVHIEDGGWVNPEGDWGDPQFVKWLYPPARSPNDKGYNANDPRTFIDIEGGFSASWRSWAVIIAGANLCETAEQMIGSANVDSGRIARAPANAAERCWHHYLSGLDSGFMYYGDSLDDEVKQSLAVNTALEQSASLLKQKQNVPDQTAPSILRPQRWPYNPGGMGWGVTTRYRPVGFSGQSPHARDFYVWSLVHDMSGVAKVVVKVRQSLRGTNSPADADNETYAGGSSVGPWREIPMNRRVIDPAFRGDPPSPNLNFFIMPKLIADHWWAKITGYAQVLLDYYIEATDAKGNVAKSDIFHVWVE